MGAASNVLEAKELSGEQRTAATDVCGCFLFVLRCVLDACLRKVFFFFFFCVAEQSKCLIVILGYLARIIVF